MEFSTCESTQFDWLILRLSETTQRISCSNPLFSREQYRIVTVRGKHILGGFHLRWSHSSCIHHVDDFLSVTQLFFLTPQRTRKMTAFPVVCFWLGTVLYWVQSLLLFFGFFSSH